MALANATIAEVTSVVTKGTTPTTLGRQFTSKGIGFIKAECISDDGALITEKQVYIDSETDQLLKRSRLQKDDVLFSIAGVIGRTAIVQQSALPANTNQAIAILRPDTTKIIPRFLYYTVRARGFQNHSLGHVVQTAQANVSLGVLSAAPIWLPPLPIQRRIAAILSAYDELIENSQRRIKILESMARALYREWFVHFRFPGHESVPRVPSPLGEIPEGWSLGKLGDFCVVIPGYAFKSKDWKNSGVPVIKIKNIGQDNTIDTENTDFVSEDVFQSTNSKFVVSNGDILIAMTGATAGKIGKLRTHDRFLLNQRVAKIQPSDEFRSLVWCAISTDESQERFYRLADGAAQPNMSGSQIERVEFIWPPKNIAVAFSEIENSILLQIDTLYIRIQNLRRTRDLLLPRLLSGQIDVEAMPA